MSRNKIYLSEKSPEEFRAEVQNFNNNPEAPFTVNFATENNFIAIPIYGTGSMNLGFNGKVYQDSQKRTIVTIDSGVGMGVYATILIVLMVFVFAISNKDTEDLVILSITLPVVFGIAFLMLWFKNSGKKKAFDSLVESLNLKPLPNND